jgi:hypothetical protein
MGEELGTMQFRVQGEQLKKEKKRKMSKKKKEYKDKIYKNIYEKRKNI